MFRSVSTPFAVCGILALSACASKYAQVPARLDLQSHGRVAIVAFSAESDHAGLGAMATQRFADAVMESQAGFELIELDGSDPALKGLSSRTDPIVLAQAIGEKKDVPVVFVGHLKTSGVKPRARLSASDLNLRASVSAELNVRLLSTRTGGTLWRSSSAANGTVGKVALAGGLPSIAVRDSDETYGEMIQALVNEATRDLRPSWIKQ